MTPRDDWLEALWSASGWTMLHFVWVGAILGAGAAIGRRLLRSAGADVRYAYALACLAVLAATPPAIAWRLFATGVEGAVARPLGFAAPAPIVRVMPEEISIDGEPPGVPTAALTAGLPFIEGREPGPLSAVARLLPYVWLTGSPLTFATLAFGLAGAERLRRQGRPIADPAVLDLARRLAGVLGVTRRVALVAVDRLASPVLVGIVRPAILLPAAALSGWSPEQLEMALLHELVHVRRLDNLVLLLQRLVESALFFHPAVWVVSGWVHREREHCCDRAVVRITGRPLAYAEALLAIADGGPAGSRRGRPVAAAMARGNLVVRIRRLFDPEEAPMKLPRLTVALAAGLLLAPAGLLGIHAALSRPDEPARAGGQDKDRNEPKARDKAPGLIALGAIREALSLADEPARGAGQDKPPRQIASEAIRVIRESKNDKDVDSWALTDIAESLAALGDREAALETLREAARVAAGEKQWVSREGKTMSYGPSTAHQVWRVAFHQRKMGDKAGALETLRLATKAEIGLDSARERLGIPALIAKEFTLLGAEEEARKIAEQVDHDPRAQGPDLAPQRAAVLAAAGDFDGAFRVLGGIAGGPGSDLRKQHLISQSVDSMAQSVAITDKGKARLVFERMLRALDEVKLTGLKSSPLVHIAFGLAEIGAFDRALQAARLIGEGEKEPGSDPEDSMLYAMPVIAGRQILAGETEGALRTLREAYRVVLGRERTPVKRGRLLTIASLMARAGDPEGALRCADEMPPSFHRTGALTQIGIYQQKAGDRDGARATFLRAIEDAESRRGKLPKLGVDTPNYVGAEVPDEASWNAGITAEVVKIRALMGEYEQARALAESIPDPARRSFALADVARAQAAAGDAAGALDWARDLKLPPTDPNPLKAIVQGIADAVRDKGEGPP